jgi:hypothetical protein
MIANGTPVKVRYESGSFSGTVVTYAPDLGGYVLLVGGEQWVAPKADVTVA